MCPYNFERAFEAWRPYLPPSVASGGPHGLSRLLVEEARDWSEAPDAAPAGVTDFSGEATVRARVRERLEATEMRALLGRPLR